MSDLVTVVDVLESNKTQAAVRSCDMSCDHLYLKRGWAEYIARCTCETGAHYHARKFPVKVDSVLLNIATL